MSIIPRFCSEIGGMIDHLQCPHCGHFSKSHAHQLSHIAACHPTTLDTMAFGRLGNVMLYQSTARLFHCAECFFTFKEFGKLYTHLITKHCMDKREEGGGDDNISDKVEGKTGEGEVVKIKEEEEMEEEEEQKMGEEGEELMLEEAEEKSGEEGVEKTGQEGEGKTKIGEEREKKEKVTLVRKLNGEGEEEEEEEVQQQAKDGATQRPEYVKAERDESMLVLEDGIYHCLICGCKNTLKTGGINHVVHKHNIPRAYVMQVMRMDAAAGHAPKQLQSSGEEEEAIQLSGEMLKEEMHATAKVIRNTAHRFMCQICGWKTKLKGFAISHVERIHDVERPYSCKECPASFLLPSRLQHHIGVAHRPGCYACPFCCFRSHFIGGFRRHCSRCNARDGRGGEEGKLGRGYGEEEYKLGGGYGEEEDKLGGGYGEEEDNEEPGEEEGVGRKRRRVVRVIKEEEEEENEEEDD